MKSCTLCRHNRRIQNGPNAWLHECALSQRDYPNALDCAQYEPPPLPAVGYEQSGMGYVFDAEVWDGQE
jgi:hypothetical protein